VVRFLAVAIAAALAVLGGATGCSSVGPDGATNAPGGSAAAGSGASETGSAAGARPDQVTIVASTNVWGNIAAQIGGNRVAVTSLISDPSQDPHTFQPSGRDELAVSRADIVIENGGGYDDFLGQMVDSVGHRATVVNAVEAAASVPSVDPDNEHIWLNTDAVVAVASRIADAIAERDGAHRQAFRDATTAFDHSLKPIRAVLATIADRDAGTPIAVTEPLPLYLAAAAGLTNIAPEKFTEAMEEGIDVSPSDLSEVLRLFTDHRVRVLMYNEQSASGQAEQVLAAARENGIPVLPLTELLPSGESYQRWMTSMVDQLAELLPGTGSR
jgi:zinc/manganese transport system substrate-binding protein